MTTHLTEDERIDALEGALTAQRQSHLDECAACQAELAPFRQVLARVSEARADDVPEPSPLFWDHLQQRVGHAVDATAQPAVAWWRGSPRAWFALATATAVVAVALVLPQMLPVPEPVVELAETTSVIDPFDESGHWQFVSDVLGSFEAQDVREVLEPSRAAIDAAFETLSPAERDAFARLLEAELAGSD